MKALKANLFTFVKVFSEGEIIDDLNGAFK